MDRFSDSLNGIFLVDKPAGITSHDVVDAIRRRFGLNKVGHAGTLDPQATGLLVIMVGRATKLANSLMSGNKTYEGSMRMGVATDSQDADGKVLREADFSAITREKLLDEMAKWSGDVLQTPPMVSAAKQKGVPLYKLARRGQTVERRPKLIHIFEFVLLDFNLPSASFRLRCSKGVYVRTICSDIGDALGCGAILESLRRTQSGDFTLDAARPLDALLELSREALRDLAIPMNRINLQPGQAQ